MKQGNKNKIGAVEFEQFTNELAKMDKIASLMCEVNTAANGYKPNEGKNYMQFYDTPPFHMCNDGKWRYPCNDGKWRTHEEIVNYNGRSRNETRLLPPSPRRGRPALRSIVAKIRATIAKALGNGQRKREKGERE